LEIRGVISFGRERSLNNMELSTNTSYKHKTAKTICKIINIDGDTLECVYPPDSYVFHYRRELFESYFMELK